MPALPYLVRAAKKANTQASQNNYVSNVTSNTVKSAGWRGDQNVTITGNSQKEEYIMDDIGNAV
jgi:hypothetical protein